MYMTHVLPWSYPCLYGARTGIEAGLPLPGHSVTAVKSKSGTYASPHLHGETGPFLAGDMVHGFQQGCPEWVRTGLARSNPGPELRPDALSGRPSICCHCPDRPRCAHMCAPLLDWTAMARDWVDWAGPLKSWPSPAWLGSLPGKPQFFVCLTCSVL